MPVGQLRAAYAYEVAPQQEGPFAGGLISVTSQLEAELNTSFENSRVLDDGVAVNFQVDTSPSSGRSHPIRDAALKISFSADPQTAVAKALAARFAAAMDRRSKPALFMVTTHDSKQPTHRRFLLWTFPRQEVFTLTVNRGRAVLATTEAFTRESELRKLAMVEGSDKRTSMLSARVVDFQARSSDRAAADLWIKKFLEARLQMSDAEGTRLLASALRAAHNKARGDHTAQDRVSGAIAALRVSTERRWSLEEIASTYLGEAAEAFLSAIRPEERSAVFGVDQEIFDHQVQFKRFILENGVVVSAPFVELGTNGGVIEIFEDHGIRRLQVAGQIQDELVRSRA